MFLQTASKSSLLDLCVLDVYTRRSLKKARNPIQSQNEEVTLLINSAKELYEQYIIYPLIGPSSCLLF